MTKKNIFFLILLLGIIINCNNVLSEQVEIKSDFVEISPEYYDVILENDRVRVLEYRLPPGKLEAMHEHFRYGVIFYLKDAVFQVIGPDGSERKVEVKKGDTFWRAPEKHAMKNLGSRELIARVVELKM